MITGHAVVYHAQAAQASNERIKCRYCICIDNEGISPNMGGRSSPKLGNTDMIIHSSRSSDIISGVPGNILWQWQRAKNTWFDVVVKILRKSI